MAQGNMFRKQRSTTRSAPATTAFKSPFSTGPDFWYAGEQRPNLQTSPQRSVLPNPIAPAAAEAQANAAFMRGNPGFGTSSLDATQRFRGMTANTPFQSSMVNGYVGTNPVSRPFDEQASRARAQEYMRGNVDQTNTGGRFGGRSPLGPNSAYAQSGGVPWHERVMNDRTEARRAQDYVTSQAAMGERMATQNPLSRMENVFVKPSRDGQGLAYTDKLQALWNMPPDTPGRKEAIAAEGEARLEAGLERESNLRSYKEAHGGLNAQGVGRQRRQERREQGKYDKAVRQGMNPMSPQAQALFPGQTKSFMEQRNANKGIGQAVQNPMAGAASAKFGPASSKPTLKQREAANTFLKEQATGLDSAGNRVPRSAILSGLGAQDTTVLGLHTGILGVLESGADPEVDDLREVHAAVLAMGKTQEDPFNLYGGSAMFGSDKEAPFGPLYGELATQSEPTDEYLTDWWKRFRRMANPVRGLGPVAGGLVPPMATGPIPPTPYGR